MLSMSNGKPFEGHASSRSESEKRQEQNRKAQKAYRVRKKEYTKSLEEMIRNLQKKVHEEIAEKDTEIASLKSQIASLKEIQREEDTILFRDEDLTLLPLADILPESSISEKSDLNIMSSSGETTDYLSPAKIPSEIFRYVGAAVPSEKNSDLEDDCGYDISEDSLNDSSDYYHSVNIFSEYESSPQLTGRTHRPPNEDINDELAKELQKMCLFRGA